MKKVIKTITIIFVMIFVLSIVNIGKSYAATKILKITNAEIYSKSSEVSGEVLSFNDDSFTSNVTYHRLNDYVEYKITIKNTDDEKHIIDVVVDDNDSSYFEYEYDEYKNTILDAGESTDIYIKEIYRNSINSTTERNVNNKVSFTFNLIDDEKNESIINVLVNPETGDNIYFYIITATISFALLLFLLSLLTNKWHSKNKKFIVLSILVAFLSLPFTIYAAESEDFIVLNNSVNLYDKLVVSYNVDGETNDVTVKYGKKIKEPASPVKDGYTFLGWYNGEGEYVFSTLVKEDLVLTAKFSKNVYTITYNLDGGTAKNPDTYKVNELPLKLKNAKKTGYTFLGWNGSNGETPQKDLNIKEVNNDLEYFANFDAIEYKINYIGLNKKEINSLNNPKKYTIEDTISLSEPSDRLDTNGDVATKFIGWKDSDGNISKNVSFSNSTGDKTYEAMWQKIKPDTHTISYTLNGGVVDGDNPTTFTSSTASFTLNNPSKVGYNFDGWTGSNGSNPEKVVTIDKGTTDDLEFFAKFSVIDYKIDYNLAGGEATNPLSYTVNDTFTLNNPVKRGYEFDGWTGTGLSNSTKNVTIPVNSTGDKSYTASFKLKYYNITYKLHGGSASDNQDSYTIEDTFTLNNPTKVGYEFDGWTGSNGDTPEKNVTISNATEDKTFEANFIANTYTIYFDSNDNSASGEMEPQQVTYDVSTKLTKNSYSKTGYEFDGWRTNNDGTGTGYDDEEVVTNLLESGSITLYAKWKKVSTATFAKGSTVNIKMKTLSGQSNVRESTGNATIKKIKYYAGVVPDEYRTDNNVVSDPSSEEKIYMWWNGDEKTIYYGSDADVLYTGVDASYFFNVLSGCEEIDNHFRTDKTTKMTQMYFGNHELIVNDVSHFNTSNVTSMVSMFGENFKIPSYNIKSWDVSKVTEFNFMFNQNTEIVSLDLTGWNTSSATNMRNMFSSMYKLKTLKITTFDTSKVTVMQSMFDNERSIESLDLSHLDTSKVTNMSKMFYNMYELENLVIPFDTRNVTTMENMFIGTNKIKVLDLSTFNTSKVNNFKNMFSKMTSIKTIYVSDLFVTSGVTSNPIMFENDTSLVGGNGTTFTNGADKLDYAHIDGGSGNPGYFTRKD